MQLSSKYTYKMVVDAGSFQAETFFSSTPLHETFMPNGGVFRSLHSHGFGQCSRPGSELLDAKRLAFATESTVELRRNFCDHRIRLSFKKENQRQDQ